MKQILTATFMFDPLNAHEHAITQKKVDVLICSGYVETVRTMNKEGQVIVKLESETIE